MGQPNVLLIMTDQHHIDWLSCAGTDYVQTPNIDRIARKGVRFTRAACNSPLCAPSRAALAGGVLPHRLNVLNNQYLFPVDHPTYYQELRKAGYRVGMVGKTDLHKPEHFYGEQGDRPLLYHFGFTDPHETEGKWNAFKSRGDLSNSKEGAFICAGPYQKHLQEKGLLQTFVDDFKMRNQNGVQYANGSALPTEDFHDSYIGMKSVEFLENVPTESPWHLFVSFVGPHDPWDPPAKYVTPYLDKEYPDSIEANWEGKPEWFKQKAQKHSEGMTPEQLNNVKQHYAGAIACIDDWVGKILGALAKRKMDNNTAIIFCADHGEMMGDFGAFQKTNMYESSLRIPLVISSPDQSLRGTSSALVELIDLYPTILEMVGVDFLSQKLDGESLVSLLQGEKKDHKTHQVSLLSHCRMIADDRYKYIESTNDIHELYDLYEDPQELHNIAESEPVIVTELQKKLKEICM